MNQKHLSFVTAFILLIVTVTASCSPSKPTETVLVDSAFSEHALIDANNNEKTDTEDTPVANAIFYVVLNGVIAFGEITDESGNAPILIPGGVEYPVEVSMEAPKDSTLKLISPSTVTVSASTGTVQFPFSK